MTRIKKKLTANFIANIYSQFVSIIYLILTVPLFLSYWPIELYGEWLVLSALPSYIALSNMGLMNVAQNKMTIAMSKNDLLSAKKNLHTVWGAQLGISFAFGVIIFIFINQIELVELFKLKLITEYESKLVLYNLTVFSFLNLQVGIFGGIYRAIDKNSRGVIVINTIRLLSITSVAIVLFFDNKNVIDISIAMTFSYLLGSFIVYYDSSKIAPELKPGIKNFDINNLKESITLGFAFMAYPIGRAITNQGMLLFTNAYVGSASVVILTSLRSVVNMAFQISNLIHLSTWPEYSRLHGRNELEGLRRLFNFSTALGFWFGVACALFLLTLGPYLIEIWTRGEVIVSRNLLSLFLIAIIINSTWYTSLTIFNATNNHKNLSKIFIAASCLVPISSFLFHMLWKDGLEVIGISFILMEVIMFYSVVPRALSLLEIDSRDWKHNLLKLPFKIIK
ncbi:lipopolysaccharide biosynthesis protein [Vibrio fluvialis]|nr:lipopolysaccharide biosynthesis protein [Vibrio fluvialis]